MRVLQSLGSNRSRDFHLSRAATQGQGVPLLSKTKRAAQVSRLQSSEGTAESDKLAHVWWQLLPEALDCPQK